MPSAAEVVKHREPVNMTLRVLLKATGVPQVAPGVDVPAGASVYVRGHNGTDAGNTKPIKVGAGPDEALSGPNRSVAPNTQVPYPCVNTREICVIGTKDDGAEITIVG